MNDDKSIETEGFRKALVEKVCSRTDFPINQQNVHTPFNLCHEMISALERNTGLFDKTFLTTNLEFVEVLIHDFGVKPGNITFITDCKQKENIAAKHPRYIGVRVFLTDYLNCVINDNNMKFDVCTLNPPFNSNIDLQFIQKAVELTKPNGHIIVVHPSISTITRKSTKRYADHKTLLNGHVKSIKLFNGNPVFGIGLFYPCQIVHITPDKTHTSFPVEYDLFGEKHTDIFTSLFDVTKWGNVPEYYSLEKKILAYCESNGNCDDKLGGNYAPYNRNTKGEYFVGFAVMRGNHSDEKIFKDDFYTIVRQDDAPTTSPSDRIWFAFATKLEAENMLKYLKSDFARFCLSIFKTNPQLARGELKSVPYFPSYAQEWTKERITTELGITDAEWAFIEKVIPPYYN